ncbi:MAG: CPBP family intramembrane metalloprotease [Bacteroidia bacterium]|nr:CPBP family intramembrane metalloprotease [Bacteroidia bacterium]
MKNIISLNESDLTCIVSIVGSALFFILYWSLLSSERIRKYFYEEQSSDVGKIKYILFTKYSGLLILGVLPGILFYIVFPHYSLSDYGLSFSKGTSIISFYWILVLGFIILVMNRFAARREKAFLMYPQIRVKEWDGKLIVSYSIAWSAYLFGYELLFRGFLFFPLVNVIGIWPAISINIALYSISHIPKGLDETVGAILLGTVLCIATLQTGTIWVAFVAHVLLALSNSLFALKFHPEMRIVKVRNAEMKLSNY